MLRTGAGFAVAPVSIMEIAPQQEPEKPLQWVPAFGYSKLGRSEIQKTLNQLFTSGSAADFDAAGQLPDFEIVERRCPLDDVDQYDCLKYVSQHLPEAIVTDAQFSTKMRYRGVSFLREHGYSSVAQPMDGDIVLYVLLTRDPNSEDEEPDHPHFGIYDSGKVISKWGPGHVFRHPVEAVTDNYGQAVIFMRKPEHTEVQQLAAADAPKGYR